MIEATNPEIDVEQLMAHIREEVARRKSLINRSISPSIFTNAEFYESTLIALDQIFTTIPEYRLQPEFTPNPSHYYTLDELLQFHDYIFIVNAYLAILKRPADDGGLQHFLNLLRQGESKITILGRLRFSIEGRHAGVKIQGLASSFLLDKLYRTPVLGRILRTLAVFANLTNLERNQRCFEAYAAQRWEIFNNYLIENNRMLQKGLVPLNALLKNLTKNKADIVAVQDFMNNLNQEYQEQTTQLYGTLQNDVTVQLRRLDEYKEDTTAIQGLISNLKQQHYDQTEQLHEILQNDVVAKLQLLDEHKVDVATIHALIKDHKQQHQEQMTQLHETWRNDVAMQLRLLDERKVDLSQLTSLTNHFTEIVQAKVDQAALAELRDTLTQTVQTKLDQTSLVKIESGISELQQRTQDQKRSLLDQQRRLGLLLEEARKRLPSPFDNTQLTTLANEADHLLSAMYVTFEDRFRGDRSDIKQRVAVYLPMIKDAQVGTTDTPIVDIGCGRGEWLELLNERGLTARGVDLNRIMVNECRERGFEVIEADALHYLQELPDCSLGAVTGMHIIEHLPLPTLIAVLDESLRVLRPGGLAIFETPNPENLIVGACNFYMDPTHRNPLPPPMIEYLVEARGFVRVEIQRWRQGLQDPLQFLPAEVSGAVELNPLIRIAKEYYFAAPDYAVVGYKA